MTPPERRNYRRLYVRIWNSPEFKRLSESHRLLTLYILTGPQTNRVGVYAWSHAAAAETFGTTVHVIKTRLATICNTFQWQFDPITQVLWVPSGWEWNPVESQKTFMGYLTDLNNVPRCTIAARFCEHTLYLSPALQPLLAAWLDRLSPLMVDKEGRNSKSRKPTPGNTETKTDTETETERKDSAEASSAPAPPATRSAFEPAHTGTRGASEPRVPSPSRVNRGQANAVPELLSKPGAAADVVFLTFPVVGTSPEKAWPLIDAQVDAWVESFPNLDVRGECRKALTWLIANPQRTKTAVGMPRFLVRWLMKAVDDGRAPATRVEKRPAVYGDWVCPHRERCRTVVLCRKLTDVDLAVVSGRITDEEGERLTKLYQGADGYA